MKRTLSITLLLFAFLISKGLSQTDSTSNRFIKDVKYTLYPIVFSLPETSWGFGGAGVGTFRLGNSNSESKPSTIQLAAVYTLKKQLLLFAPYDFQFDNNRKRLSGELGYFKYFFNYYGIGLDILKEVETYDVNFPRVIINYEQSIKGPHYLGARYSFDYYHKYSFQKDGNIEKDKPLGYKMGISTGLGLRYRYDTRDNYFYPSKGFYFTWETFFNTKWLGSNYNYIRHEANLSYFKTIYKEHILALNTTWQDSGEGTPFFDLPWLAKPAIMRGYSDRKYANNKLGVIQAEYRFPIYWRFKGVLFTSYGTVADKWKDLATVNWKWSYGAGLRFVLNKQEKVNVRLDFGFGHQEDFAFYLTVKEVF